MSLGDVSAVAVFQTRSPASVAVGAGEIGDGLLVANKATLGISIPFVSPPAAVVPSPI